MSTAYSLLTADSEATSPEFDNEPDSHQGWAIAGSKGVGRPAFADETDDSINASSLTNEFTGMGVEDEDHDSSRDIEGTRRNEDLVYLYFREMGASRILSREEEVVLVRSMERGGLKILKVISRSAICIQQLVQ